MSKKKDKEFQKFDGAKSRVELVPPSAIQAMGDVFAYGAEKYEVANFLNCKEPERFVGALLRHTQAFQEGEVLDPESGLPHLHHAMTNLAILVELERHGVVHESYFKK